MRVAIYARVSTFDQEPENQLAELRQYVSARGWTSVEYVDRGVSGSKDRRPALDQLVADARRLPQMDGFIAGRRVTLQEGRKGTLTDLPDLPREIDAGSTAAYIQEVLAGSKPVPSSMALLVEHILQLARSL